MHHVPWGPSLYARIRAALRARRVVPAMLVGMVAGVAVIALAVPAMSGSRAPVSLDSSSSDSADGRSPVVLGQDGGAATAAPTSRHHRPATASTASTASTEEPSVRTGAVAGDPTGRGTSPATQGASDRQTPAGSTGPAGTPAASSWSPSPAPVPTSSPPPSSPASSPSSAPSTSSSSSPSPAALGYSDNVLSSVNTARTDAGCAPLTADAALATAAVANSTGMAVQGTPAVVDPAGTSGVVAAGESDADAVVSAWLADPSDKATLLDCGLTSAGVGEVSAPGGPWWTLFLS